MNLSGLLPILKQHPAYGDLLDTDKSSDHQTPQSLLSSARAYVTAGFAMHRPGALVLLTARSEMAQQLTEQLRNWLPPAAEGGPDVHLFAEPDALPYERIPWSSETRQSRLTALTALQSRSGVAPILIVSARALMQKTLPAKELRLSLRPVSVGDIIRLEQMTLNWAQTGYNPVELVEEPGTFARRGGIVDIWPPNLPNPVRFDLFGDELDSLRIFDPATQRTLQHVDHIEIGPGSEALCKYGPTALKRLGVEGEHLNAPQNIATGGLTSPLHDPKLLLAIREELRAEVDNLSQSQSFRGIEWYLPYLYSTPACLLDYLPPESTLLIDDGDDLMATLAELEAQATTLQAELQSAGELPEGFANSFFDCQKLRGELLSRDALILGHGDLYGKSTSANTPLARGFIPGPRHGGKTKPIVAEIERLKAEGHAVVLITRQAERLKGLLGNADITIQTANTIQSAQITPSSVLLTQGVIGEGFVIRGLTDPESQLFNLHFLTDTELFGWSKPQARRRTKARSSVAPEIFFADVKQGDFVVHLEHGIGQFDGLIKMEMDNMEREYIQVTYARGDKLYVPVHQADRLSRYVGASEGGPNVTRLGTADWQTIKDRAKRAVADIADDLLKLYAERELIDGFSYSPDSPWQQELEESFPYQETDDQLHAVEAIKRDMESGRPMDRLICGDVGYGKTEVAIRAAFKAVLDGRQVAMLVPTTVLAQQHYRTISARLAQYPVQVDVLSRFRTPLQQRKTVEGLEKGNVDIVVGTHRLLSKDVAFKELGLLIIDEEQRFGVTHKEKLKQLRTQVDVLTLSATPIPRTLHMSLSGVRDMSTISTPPKERLPVQTTLAEYDDVLVRQAIQRELNRNGQVFFVHNRVRGIQQLAERIQRVVPEAAIAVAHGQMPERALEEVMMQFADGTYDVLISTTIIENGLDIPNANTIIINRADKFGLAQLYQLRGRVGRSAARGHCYLLYEKNTPLSFDARRRLSAILESSEELGAGFRIAMRDLEIRGAGDLLGARQHGNIDTVGFDLYTRLLAQAINDAKKRKEYFDRAQVERVPSAGDGSEGEGIEAAEREAVMGMGNGLDRDANGDVEVAGSPLDDTPFDVNDPLAPPVTLELPLEARIPTYYIEDDQLRLQIYRRIAGMTHIESIAEMRKELRDRFGVHHETKDLPREVENLLFQIKVKILALKASVQNIGRELDQIVVRSEALENMNRKAMERRLRIGLGQIDEEFLAPEEVARVSRRSIYLPIDAEGRWQIVLVRTLEIMAYS